MAISTFLGLETTLRGLLAEQRALDVTGHNIANANTVGYSRQEAVLSTSTPYTDTPAGQIGTGVEVTAYERLRDTFLDAQYRTQSSQQGAANALQDGLSQVEDALAEPSDTGLNALLGKYWAAWQDVANSPDDAGTRAALVQAAKTLTDGLNGLAGQLDTLSTQTQTQEIPLAVDQVNALAKQIAELDGQIDTAETVSGSTGGVYPKPNDLLDKRDELLDQLSQLVPVTVSGPASGAKDGEITVGIGVLVSGGSNAIVDGDTQVGQLNDTQGTPPSFSNTYTIGTGAGAPQVSFGSAGGTAYSGKLGGLQEVLDKVNDPTSGYLARLDQVAQQLASGTNALHGTGADLSGAPVAGTSYASFFVAGGGSTLDASTIAVNPDLLSNPNEVAAGSTGAGPGDGSVALAIADLRTATPSSVNADDLYTSLVTTVGTDSQEAGQDASVAKTLTDSLESRRQSVSGVSLDEEMTNLVRFQRGYQAAARALTAMDDMLDQLISRTGRAGL